VSPDLKHAKVFFGVVNKKKNIKNIAIELNKKSKAFRKYLGQKLTIKFTPALKFYYDDSIAHVKRIDELFSQLKKDDIDI
jgi:ribosome-binding factor A